MFSGLSLALAALTYYPTPDDQGGWRTREPVAPVRATLDRALEAARVTSPNGGLLVLQDGHLVYERYWGHASRDATPNLASVGKAVTSVAVGILIDERRDLFPAGLDQKVFTERYLPAAVFPLDDPRKAEIRLGQLLTMTSGLRGNTPGYVQGKPVRIDPPGLDGWQAVVDERALASTLWCAPGAGYSYATAAVHIASMIVRHITGRELAEYVGSRIAKPLGWGKWGYGYRRPEIQHTPGGGGIELRGTDALRFGYLLLNLGRWNDSQVVPADYVRQCSRASSYNPHYPYSLQFDVNTSGQVAGVPRDAFWKTGSGGHCLYVVPSLRLVVWKLGGRNDQYGLPNTGTAVRRDTDHETLKLVLAALKRR